MWSFRFCVADEAQLQRRHEPVQAGPLGTDTVPGFHQSSANQHMFDGAGRYIWTIWFFDLFLFFLFFLTSPNRTPTVYRDEGLNISLTHFLPLIIWIIITTLDTCHSVSFLDRHCRKAQHVYTGVFPAYRRASAGATVLQSGLAFHTHILSSLLAE